MVKFEPIAVPQGSDIRQFDVHSAGQTFTETLKDSDFVNYAGIGYSANFDEGVGNSTSITITNQTSKKLVVRHSSGYSVLNVGQSQSFSLLEYDSIGVSYYFTGGGGYLL